MQNIDSWHQLNTDFVNNNTEHRFSMPNTERVNWIDNNLALVQIMAWCQTDDKPLSEPMMAWFGNTYMRLSASMG